MKNLFFVILLLICCKLSAQKKTKKPFPPPPHIDDCFCKESQRFDIKQRLLFYPFNLAKKIEFVSYSNDIVEEVVKNDSSIHSVKQNKTKLILNSKYRKSDINKSISFPNFEEKSSVDSLNINKLTNTFFNLENKKSICINSCNIPRNAILFYDKNGDLMEYIDICFECLKHTKSYKTLDNQSYWCEQKYWQLKELFAQVGVKYGTTKP